jgi:hypothetical protein
MGELNLSRRPKRYFSGAYRALDPEETLKIVAQGQGNRCG